MKIIRCDWRRRFQQIYLNMYIYENPITRFLLEMMRKNFRKYLFLSKNIIATHGSARCDLDESILIKNFSEKNPLLLFCYLLLGIEY